MFHGERFECALQIEFAQTFHAVAAGQCQDLMRKRRKQASTDRDGSYERRTFFYQKGGCNSLSFLTFWSSSNKYSEISNITVNNENSNTLNSVFMRFICVKMHF
jgi:hypothetical protein